MFTPEELNLISISLVCLRGIVEVDLMNASDYDKEFKTRVEKEYKETSELMDKVKSLIQSSPL